MTRKVETDYSTNKQKNTVRADKIMPSEEFLNWYATFLLQRSRYWSNLKS